MAASSYAQNTLYIHTSGSINGHSGSQLGIFGSVHNNGVLSASGGQVYYTGSNAIVVLGDSVAQFDTVNLNVSQQVQLLQELRIGSRLIFTDGYFLTNRNDSTTVFVHFMDNSTHTGSSDSSHVNGVVRKTGDDTFTFPVGNQNHMQAVAISAPSSASHHFTAFYRMANASNYSMSTYAIDSNCGGSNIIKDISEKEYWYLQRSSGNSNVIVTLSLDEVSAVSSLSQVMPARWTGSQWRSIGNGGSTGSTSDGSISSGTGCGAIGSPTATDSFGFFTFSASNLTALPVELLHFDAQKHGDDVLLTWSTAMQWNHSHFDVERSTDGIHFNYLTTVGGESFTNEIQTYEVLDHDPYGGLNYYRLKQVDLDGKTTYSDIRLVDFSTIGRAILIYPNPTKDVVYIERKNSDIRTQIELFDAVGRSVMVHESQQEEGRTTISLKHLPTGVYTMRFGSSTTRIIKE
jgi:hypothetical protein